MLNIKWTKVSKMALPKRHLLPRQPVGRSYQPSSCNQLKVVKTRLGCFDVTATLS